ncbi:MULTISPECIES: ABC-2 transporter permease [Bacillus cereus group]|uniref:ABC transporter permease n=1 Tax=Bacillus cereus (strain VD146) TaxID=1053236 RepID=R8MNH7_BACCX|nr:MULTISPECIES: ABC-2 transporter permease [Bacillus cereus group]EOP35736.1 ABC transporter permease [Bacillus cereus VD146]MDR4903524.1 ABC-2 transporter permease [Bacillus mycoides]
MQQLILKEFFLQRTMFLIYLILPIYGVLQQSIEPFQLAFVCFVICLLMISISLSNEEKNSTEKVLVSLPFTRKDIVIAKYISTVFFIGVSLIITFVFFIIPVSVLRENTNIPWYALFIAIFFFVLYAGMILPMKYSVDKQTVTILGAVMLFPIIGLLGFMCNIFAEERLMLMFFRSSDVLLVISILSLGACLSYFASMFLSIVSFKKKEL